MRNFFNAENPIWRFIGNIADMFIMSILWYSSLLPIITAGAGTTAMYYYLLKLTKNQEGELFSAFFSSFRTNFKQSARLLLVFLPTAAVLAADLYWCVYSGAAIAPMLLPAAIILCVIFVNWATLVFPLLARVENSTKNILWISFVLSVRNFLPVFSASLLTCGLIAAGLFVAWPVLLIAPGFAAYINSYIFNRIFDRAGLSLDDN